MFDDSESDSNEAGGELRINKDYAQRYDRWREKEELQKLKARYGDIDVNELDEDESSSSDSESEDEDAEALNDKLEEGWMKTLKALQDKDPKIYDKTVKFYEEEKKESDDESEETDTNKAGSSKSKEEKKGNKKKDKGYYLKDYERDLIVQKGGKYDDESDTGDEFEERNLPKSYRKEQEELRKNVRAAVNEMSDDDSGEEFLTKRKKTKEEEEKEDKNYKVWLQTQKKEKELKLAGYDPWDKPNMNDNDKFLRDFFINKKFIGNKQEEHIPTYDEIVEEEEGEEEVERQEEFERKYNFRFQEPDKEFIQSYPRTIAGSVRRKDDKRARRRQELRDNKKLEKERKQEELKQLKNLKRREIMQKIEKLKEITGNPDIGFSLKDIGEDFDPVKYDNMMKSAFNDDYYEQEGDDEKPVFDDDEELGLDEENWDEWTGANQEGEGQYDESDVQYYDNNDSHYYNDPNEWNADDWENIGETSNKKKRKKKSKFAKAVAQKKPVFDPNDKTFEQYIDEYYKLDYEDVIGDLPCRFKYRSVMPNDFGLTTDEILRASEKELNQWVSVKRMSQYRSEEEEMTDLRKYQRKARRSKHNVLQSLSEKKNKDNDNVEEMEGEATGKKKKKRKKKKKNVDTEDAHDYNEDNMQEETNEGEKDDEDDVLKPNVEKKKKKKHKNKNDETLDDHTEHDVDMEDVDNVQKAEKKKNKKKRKHKDSETDENTVQDISETNDVPDVQRTEKKKNKKKRKREDSETVDAEFRKSGADVNKKPKLSNELHNSNKEQSNERVNGKVKKAQKDKQNGKTSDDGKMKKKKKKNKNKNNQSEETKKKNKSIALSEQRLKAYNIDPTKFKYTKHRFLNQKFEREKIIS